MDDHLNKKKGPTFICIGPEKTGTGWIYKNLLYHPQVFLPPVKEIRYFWEKVFLPNETIMKRYTSSHWHYQTYQRYFKTRLRFYLKNIFRFTLIDAHRLIWDFKYLFFSHNDKWYESLFDSTYKVRGDITPLYYRLPEEQINRISKLFPQLKIIIILRNPIDRVFSKAKMNLCRHRNKRFEEISEKEFYKLFDEEYQYCSSYKDLITRWERHFGKRNVHVNFFDKLCDDAFGLLDEICSFLKIDIQKLSSFVIGNLNQEVNPGLGIDLPEKHGIYLARLYRDCIKEMCEYDNLYPQRWAEDCNILLSR
jgi:hypothetical protein